MNVTHKVSFTPGLQPVTIWIITPPGSRIPSFYLPDTTQDVIQALAPEGQVWDDPETLAYTQSVLDVSDPGVFTVVLASPPEEPA